MLMSLLDISPKVWYISVVVVDVFDPVKITQFKEIFIKGGLSFHKFKFDLNPRMDQKLSEMKRNC